MEMKIKLFKYPLALLASCLILHSCNGLPKAGDARTMEMDGQKRARQNVERGGGFAVAPSNFNVTHANKTVINSQPSSTVIAGDSIRKDITK